MLLSRVSMTGCTWKLGCIQSVITLLLCSFLLFNFVQDAEHNGDEAQEEQTDEHAEGHGQTNEHVEGHDDGQEEAVVVDADSTDGAVLVNGNEADDQWGTNNEGKPSA